MKRPTLLATIPIATLFASVAAAQGTAQFSASIETSGLSTLQQQQVTEFGEPLADTWIAQDPTLPGADVPLISSTFSISPGSIVESVISSANGGGPYADTGTSFIGVWDDTITPSGIPASLNSVIYIDPIVKIQPSSDLPSIPQPDSRFATYFATAQVTGGSDLTVEYNQQNSSVKQVASSGTPAGAAINVELEAGVNLHTESVNSQPTSISASVTATLLGFTVHDSNGNLLPGITFTDSAGTIFPSIIPGDANADGVVDIQDLTTVANHWQQPVNDWSQGDFNGDGIVDIQDLTTVANHWQDGVSSGGGSSQSFSDALVQIGGLTAPTPAPEPSSLAILCLTPAILTRRRPSRTRNNLSTNERQP